MDFFSNISANIDLREELHDVIHGSAELSGQGQPLILRRMTDTNCVCWDPKAAGSSRPNCPYCKGEGWEFTETLEIAAIYRGEIGRAHV